MNEGYPKHIKDGFPGIPNNIQAASVYGDNEDIFFFKGNDNCTKLKLTFLCNWYP